MFQAIEFFHVLEFVLVEDDRSELRPINGHTFSKLEFPALAKMFYEEHIRRAKVPRYFGWNLFYEDPIAR